MVQPLGSTQFQPAITPATTHLQAAGTPKKGDGSSISSADSKSEGGFFHTILTPFRWIGEAIAYIFKSLLCCCFYSRDLKADIALIEKITKAQPKDETAAKALVKEFQALPARIQDDLVEYRLNAKMERKGVDLKDAKAVAEWKAVEKNAEWIAADAKEVKELFTSDKTTYDQVRRVMDDLAALAAKYNADLKPADDKKKS